MDDDSSGDAVLDDDAPNLENDHDDEPPEDSTDLLEPDPAEGDTPLSVPGTEAAAGTAVDAAAAKTLQVAAGPTVLERMRSAGINNARALEHLQRGWVRMDGQVVTDPDYPAAPTARWVILP
ncbi:hypothetical protein [uncultured Pseudonocardia sp.]|uniref:hypothetical protein n=1 Tax=uncultured Pseudonocardia sp. TaxID=211455 RepID=UPI0026340390|nr:hypothetical protein [uncultured Pseudonocardia sp.]